MKKIGEITNIVYLIVFLIPCTRPVQLPDPLSSSKRTISKLNDVNVCLKPDRPTKDYFSCFGHQMLQKMQDLEERDEFALADGVSMKRDEAGPRDISNFLDKDPMNYRSFVEGASALMSRRSLQWDMGFIYPGLNLRIGPTLNANGVMEFVMDPNIRDRHEDGYEHDTSRLIKRTLLLPFLLGFKFQLATLLPLIFGILVLVSKKALLLAKLAVYGTSFFGYNSLYGHDHGGIFPSHGLHGGLGGGYGFHRDPEFFFKQGPSNPLGFDDKAEELYPANNYHSPHNPYKSQLEHSPEDLRDRLERLFASKYDDKPRSSRNFAWKDD